MDNGQASDEWSQEHNEQYLHDDWTESLGVSIENPIYEKTFEDNLIVEQSFLSYKEAKKKEQRKQGKQKNVAHRGSAFSKEEDAVICSAFLHVSKDPIAGVNQSAGAYYKRMYDFFCENKQEHSRSQIGIQKRWLLIQTRVSKFCVFKSRVDRRNESGKNEQDRIDDAIKMYEDKEPFHFLHCWKILRNEAKWNDKLLELNNTPERKTQGPSNPIGTQPPPQGPIEPNNENTTITRPEGRDSAKKRRYKEETASSSAAVEVLQQMHERNEKTEQKQDEQMQEILTLKGSKMRLTEKMFDLQKQEMETKNKFKEEQLSLTKQDTEARAKQSEAQLLTAEVGIMGADLDKLSPNVRAYYIAMQQQIMERRGIVTPHNNDGA